MISLLKHNNINIINLYLRFRENLASVLKVIRNTKFCKEDYLSVLYLVNVGIT